MSNYFKQIPDFEYVSRLPGAKISDYITVKNLFKKGKLREDIFEDLSVFTKYQIKGDARPDNVAYDFYGDSTLDWLVLVSNNIINIQTEWPLRQTDFERYMLNKYGSYDTLYNGIHHYETLEVKDTNDVIILPAGLQVDPTFSIQHFDPQLRQNMVYNNVTKAVTNYEYEYQIDENKRNIFLLKGNYVNIAKDNLEQMMIYEQGSTQYVSETLKRADNIRLYE